MEKFLNYFVIKYKITNMKTLRKNESLAWMCINRENLIFVRPLNEKENHMKVFNKEKYPVEFDKIQNDLLCLLHYDSIPDYWVYSTVKK